MHTLFNEVKILDFLSPGKRIKALRKQLNIKQVELEAIGVSRNYISMVESDKRNLSGETLEKFLNFIENRADEFEVKVNLDTNYLLLPEKEEARNYCNEKLKSTLNHECLDELIEIGEKYSLTDILLDVYLLKANLLYNECCYNNAFIYYYKILEIYIDKNDDKDKAFIYTKLSKCKGMTLSYEEALVYSFKSYFYCNEFKDKINLMNCMFNICIIYKKLGEYDNALIYIDKLLNIINPKDYIHRYIDAIIVKCNCYASKGEFRTSIDIYNSTLNNLNNIPGIPLGFIYNNLGDAYLNLGELEYALLYFDKAISTRTLFDKSTLSHSLIDKSQVLIKQKYFDNSISLIQEGLALSKKYSDNEYILKGYNLLEDIYIELNNKVKLEETYLLLVEFLKDMDSIKLLGIYIKLSILYMKCNNIDKYKEFLYKAQELHSSLK